MGKKAVIQDLETMARDKEAMKDQVKQLEHEKQHLIDQRLTLQAICDQCQNDLQVKESEILKLVQEKVNMEKALESEVNKLQQQGSEVAGFQLKVNLLKETEQKLRNQNSELAKLSEEKDVTIETLQIKIQEKESIEAQFKQLEHQNAEVAEQMESFKASTNRLQSELELRENEYLNQQKEKESIKETLLAKAHELEE